MAPSNGPPDPQTEDEPAVPPPPPGAPDGVVGVAPHATIISIRQSSRAFEPVNPSSAGPNSDEKVKAGSARAVRGGSPGCGQCSCSRRRAGRWAAS